MAQSTGRPGFGGPFQAEEPIEIVLAAGSLQMSGQMLQAVPIQRVQPARFDRPQGRKTGIPPTPALDEGVGDPRVGLLSRFREVLD